MDQDVTNHESAILNLAVEQGYLTSDDVETLHLELKQGVSNSLLHSAYQRGILNENQVDQLLPLKSPTEIIPDYEFLKLLGAGGMGAVYCARQNKLDRIVAIKLMKLIDASSATRSQQEARAIARLQHPNIITAFDYGISGSRVYLVMELIEGQTLKELVEENGPIEERVALQILRQVAGALRFAANNGITHRDIKPANLLLANNEADVGLDQDVPLVKVADFGLALLTSDPDDTRLTMDGSTLGTPAYAAPEQVEDSRVDHRADIYSLGATLYFMLTAKTPYEGQSVMQIISSKLRGDQPWDQELPENVSPECRQLFERMIQPDPNQRISDYNELITEIESVCGISWNRLTSTTVAFRTSLPPNKPITTPETEDTVLNLPDTKPTRKLRWILAAFGLLFSITVIGFILSALPPGMPPTPEQQSLVASKVGVLPLFNGRSVPIRGATSGVWQTDMEDLGDGLVGAMVLAGTDGSHEFTIPNNVELFELQLSVNPLATESVLVSFPESSEEKEFTVKLADDLIQLGWTNAKDQKWDRIQPAKIMPFEKSASPPSYQRLTITKQDGSWLVHANGHLVGGDYFPPNVDYRKVRITVVSGKAHFSDFRMVPLQAIATP